MNRDALELALDAVLPQTQCTRCGFPDCRAYAHAIAHEGATIDRCPPGGAEGISRLAALTGAAERPLDPACGVEAPRALAVIDEAWCIGCTLCLDACPVDAIVGAAKQMHVIVAAQCTGCALCLPPCPVDCIAMVAVTGDRTGWAAWSPVQAQAARARYVAHRARRAGVAAEGRAPGTDGDAGARRRAAVSAAMARAQAPRPAAAAPEQEPHVRIDPTP